MNFRAITRLETLATQATSSFSTQPLTPGFTFCNLAMKYFGTPFQYYNKNVDFFWRVFRL